MSDEAATDRSSPYEAGLFREVVGATLRPGGTFLTDRAVSFCGFAPGAQLLDVGCGAGATVEHLLVRYGFSVTGLDRSRILLDQAARRNPFLALAEGRAEALPCPDGTIDGIFCECVLSLLDDPRQVLAEFRRVLRPAGYLVLSDLYQRPHAGFQACAAKPEEARASGATAEALERLVGEYGFSVLLWEDHTRLLKELTARLVLAGCPLDEFHGKGCCGTPLSVGSRPGYYLMVCRRDG
jgi:SAM-dependent methyltransferase